MTFAYKVKSDLCEADANKCCQKAMLYGMLLFGRFFSPSAVSMTTEHEATADTAAALIERLFGFKPLVKYSSRTDGHVVASLAVEGPGKPESIYAAFGHNQNNVTLRINRANLENDCCAAAFIRGAFLVSGSIVDPEKDYHLEFVTPHIKLGRDLEDFMRELEFEPKSIVRKGNYVVYFKESGQIEDVLTLMGAVQQSLELMDIKIYKDLRNKVNRVTNCETANIGKTVDASATQIDAINRIIAKGGFELIPEELRGIAQIRLDNPDASLRELAEIAKISRSGVNHRLKRILEMGERMGNGSV